MTDFEISKALALAIGWPENRMSAPPKCEIYLSAVFGGWTRFSHTDPAVIWPIAERYNLFPYALRTGFKLNGKWNAWSGRDNIHESPAKAVAMAVIHMETKKGKTCGK